MAKAYSITTKSSRSKLPVKTEPYWHKISKGYFVGYRKTKTGGTWQARFESKVKSKQKSLGDDSRMDFKEALRKAGEFCDSLNEGAQVDYIIQKAIDDYLVKYANKKSKLIEKADKLEKEEVTLKAEKAVKRLRLRLERLMNDYIDLPINELTTKMLTDWMYSRPQKKSSVKRDFAAIYAMLNYAYRQGMVSSNRAWLMVEQYTTEVENPRKIYFTDKQVSEILKKAKEPYKSYYKATVLTGARAGEIADPMVKDFNKKDRTLYIGRKVNEKRHVKLSNEAYDFIKSQCVGKLPNARIFTNEKGNQWETDDLGYEFKRIAKKIKLPEGSVLYCLRHYYISKCIEADVGLFTTATNCGTSIKQIEKTYGHLRDQGAAVEKLNLVQIGI